VADGRQVQAMELEEELDWNSERGRHEQEAKLGTG
jgi:hypothetical protein